MATSLSEPQSSHGGSASGADARVRSNTISWSILSAIGGALLLFVGQVAIEEYRAVRDTEVKAAETVRNERQQRAQLLDTLFNEYLALGDQADRAGDYVETGEGGTREDVLAVVRHFRKLIAYAVNERLEVRAVDGFYGGRLLFWSRHLRMLGSGRSPVSDRFSDNHRATYLILADALANLAVEESRDAVPQAGPIRPPPPLRPELSAQLRRSNRMDAMRTARPRQRGPPADALPAAASSVRDEGPSPPDPLERVNRQVAAQANRDKADMQSDPP